MAIRRKGGLLAGVAVLVLGSGAWAQEVEPVKPKPPPTGTSRPPAKPPHRDPDRAKPPSEPKPATPSPEEKCASAGGEWRDGQCDMAKPTCEAEGKKWDQAARQCQPKECPDGTKQEGAECVPVAPAATPPPPTQPDQPEETPSCESGARWDGERCVDESEKSQPSAAPTEESGGGSGLRTAALIGGGVLLGVGAVTGVMAISKKGEWSEQCDGKDCYASARDDYDSGMLLANVSTGTFVVGALLMTAGLFIIPGGDTPSDEPAASVKPAVNVAAGPGGGFVSARWTY